MPDDGDKVAAAALVSALIAAKHPRLKLPDTGDLWIALAEHYQNCLTAIRLHQRELNKR